MILGDLFDFLQVELDRNAPPVAETGDRITLAKLERIARGHNELFAALGHFAAAGFPVEVVPGNHDIELLRESTQRRFVQLVVAASGRPEAAARFTFHPWIFFIPGVVYAEHGHQYDDVNSFATQLQPFLDGQVDLPLGSYFVTYLFNQIEAFDPFADNVKPPTSYLLWALQHHPVRTLSTLGVHFRLLWAVLRRSKDLTPLDIRALRRAYQDDALRAYAEQIGLSYETVVAIDRLAAVPAMTSKLHQLRSMILAPLAELVPTFAAVVAIYMAIGRMRQSLRSFAMFALGIAGLAWRERRAMRPPTQDSGYLLRASRRIRRILAREGKAVPLYVFGHTHQSEQVPLTSERRPPYYMNSGTWTPTVTTAYELLAARETFSFVQITRDADGGRPVSRLMLWNDNAGRAEPLPFLGT